MVDYTTGLIWLALWPTLIYLTYRFIRMNVRKVTESENKASF